MGTLDTRCIDPACRVVGDADIAVLFVLGEDDFVGPADRLLDAVPDGRLVTLRRTDHFSTTQRLEAQDAVLSFLQE